MQLKALGTTFIKPGQSQASTYPIEEIIKVEKDAVITVESLLFIASKNHYWIEYKGKACYIFAPHFEPLTANGAVTFKGLTHPVMLRDKIIPLGHFTWAEATHGGTRKPQQDAHTANIIKLAKLLETVRELLGGLPLTIISWYRPEPFNKQAGGASDSIHKVGGAADFTHPRYNSAQMYNILTSKIVGGLGEYTGRRFRTCHVDCRGFNSRWKH